MALRDASPSSTSLELTIGDYLVWHALRGSLKRHRGDVKGMLLRLAAHTGAELPRGEVTREHYALFLRSIQGQECKPNTLKACHRVLDAFFN